MYRYISFSGPLIGPSPGTMHKPSVLPLRRPEVTFDSATETLTRRAQPPLETRMVGEFSL